MSAATVFINQVPFLLAAIGFQKLLSVNHTVERTVKRAAAVPVLPPPRFFFPFFH